jgi:hypothetical protein
MTTALNPVAEDESKFQSGEQMEEVGNMPVGEMTEASMSEEVTEKKISQKETAGFESTVEWRLSTTRGDENSKGDRFDLPITKKEVQERRLPES